MKRPDLYELLCGIPPHQALKEYLSENYNSTHDYYNRIYVLLYELPPGGTFDILCRVAPKNYRKFFCCAYCAMCELIRTRPNDPVLYFADKESTIIRRSHLEKVKPKKQCDERKKT